jgi:tetratricopeptide (TPR) repeat protein
VITQDEVVVKVGPQVVASCKMGDVLPVVSVKGNWLGVQKDGKAGWINKRNTIAYEHAQPFFDQLVRGSDDKKAAHLARARFYMENGRPQLAIRDYSQALRIGGDDVEVLNSRGLAWSVTGNTDEASGDFCRAIELAPRNQHFYVNRAGLWLAVGDYANAIADGEKAIEIAPDFSTGYHVRGTGLLFIGETERAIEDLDQAIRLDPEAVSHYSSRGLAWLAAGDVTAAFKDFHKALELDPNAVTALLNRGEAWLAIGDAPNAIRDFNDVVGLQPNNAFAYLNRGIARYAQGEIGLALPDLNRSIELKSQLPVPQVVGAYINRGLTHMAMACEEEALEDFTSAIQLDAQQSEPFLYRGEIWIRLAQTNEGNSEQLLAKAVDDLNEALRLDSTLAPAYLHRFLTRILRNEFTQALADLESAIALNPIQVREHIPGIINACRLLERRSQYREAIEVYNAVIRLDSQCAEAYRLRAALRARCDDPSIRDLPKAVVDATRACELTGWRDHQPLRILVGAYALSGDIESAIKWQKKTVELAPQQFKQDDERMLKLLEQRRTSRNILPTKGADR